MIVFRWISQSLSVALATVRVRSLSQGCELADLIDQNSPRSASEADRRIRRLCPSAIRGAQFCSERCATPEGRIDRRTPGLASWVQVFMVLVLDFTGRVEQHFVSVENLYERTRWSPFDIGSMACGHSPPWNATVRNYRNVRVHNETPSLGRLLRADVCAEFSLSASFAEGVAHEVFRPIVDVAKSSNPNSAVSISKRLGARRKSRSFGVGGLETAASATRRWRRSSKCSEWLSIITWTFRVCLAA